MEQQNQKRELLNKENPWFLPSGSIRDLILLIFSVAIFYLLIKIFSTPQIDKVLIDKILTFFMTTTGTIFGYYFGSRKQGGTWV